MISRAIPSEMSPVAVSEVDRMLEEIAQTSGVHIPWAIESGSRAWGFPSPDSDYDARFIYVRPASHLLTIWPRRDVIERPIVGDMDVNGWDLAKALKLILRGNAVVVEWLQSPIIYRGVPWFRETLLTFASDWTDRQRIASHYLHLSRRQRDLHLNASEVSLKKVFYALRPAAALRWLRLHPGEALPPMHFPTLMQECDPPKDVVELTRELTLRKAATREMGTGSVPSAVLNFIDSVIADAELEDSVRPVSPDAAIAADQLYAAVIKRLDVGQ